MKQNDDATTLARYEVLVPVGWSEVRVDHGLNDILVFAVDDKARPCVLLELYGPKVGNQIYCYSM